MKRIMLAVIAAAFATSATAADRRFTVTSFDRIHVEGPFEVTVTTGKANSVMASGSPQALERVLIDVQGKTLRIKPNRSAWGGYPGESAGPVSIALSTHELRAASLTGSGSLMIDKAKAMRFDLGISGSGRVAVGEVEADHLSLGLMGSGSIAVGGKAKELRATIQGGGDLAAEGLSVEGAQINADTAGTVSVGVNRAANVTSTGAGDTKIIGSPACTIKALGSGRVFCGS